MSKEYPWLFQPRTFLFGLIQVPQWGYRWGFSKAYIELMCLDTTIIQYPNSNSTGNSEDRDTKAEEAKRLYYQRQAEKNKPRKDIVTIKLQ